MTLFGILAGIAAVIGAFFGALLMLVGVLLFPPACILIPLYGYGVYRLLKHWIRTAKPNSQLARQHGPMWDGHQFAPRSIRPHPGTHYVPEPPMPTAMDD